MECFACCARPLAPGLPSERWETALPGQGIAIPGLGANRVGRLKPWDLVPVIKILFFPHSVCPSSGKLEFYYQQQQSTKPASD